MSLINQMLRDLEKRNPQAIATLPYLYRQVHIPEPSAKKNLRLIPIIGLLVSLGFAVHWLYNRPETHNKETNATIKQAFVQEQQTGNKKPTVSDLKLAAKQFTPLIERHIKTNPAVPVKSLKIPAPAAKNPIRIKPIKQPATREQPEPVPVVKASPTRKARQLYDQSLTQADLLKARQWLQQAISLDPNFLHARIQLTKILLNQGLTGEAVRFLDQSLQLFPNNIQFINARAQLFLQQKNPDAALNILQRIKPAIADETTLSLMAAIHQKKKSYHRAAEFYHRLTALNPDKAEYWLGSAISLENLNNRDQAGFAYQQALSKKTLKTSIVNYIKQRISLLK